MVAFQVTLLIGSAFPSLESEWTEVMFVCWVAQHAPAILVGTGKEWSFLPRLFALETVVLSSCFFLLHISSSQMLEVQHFNNSVCHRRQMVTKDCCGQLRASIRTAEEMVL